MLDGRSVRKNFPSAILSFSSALSPLSPFSLLSSPLSSSLLLLYLLFNSLIVPRSPISLMDLPPALFISDKRNNDDTALDTMNAREGKLDVFPIDEVFPCFIVKLGLELYYGTVESLAEALQFRGHLWFCCSPLRVSIQVLLCCQCGL